MHILTKTRTHSHTVTQHRHTGIPYTHTHTEFTKTVSFTFYTVLDRQHLTNRQTADIQQTENGATQCHAHGQKDRSLADVQ